MYFKVDMCSSGSNAAAVDRARLRLSRAGFECETAGTKINAGGLVGAIGTMPMGLETSLKPSGL
jgi:hypothetical protein